MSSSSGSYEAGDVAAGEDRVGGLLRAPEARVHAQVERQLGELPAEPRRLGATVGA